MARTVPASASEAPGNFLTGALWNAQVKALTDFVTGAPSAQLYASTAQSVPDGTGATILALDSEVWDSDGGHSTTTNTSRYTVQVAGKYLVLGTMTFGNNTSGIRGVGINVNGNSVRGSTVQSTTLPTANTWVGQANTVIQCAVGDYIEMYCFQTSGAALSTNPSTKFGPALVVLWVST